MRVDSHDWLDARSEVAPARVEIVDEVGTGTRLFLGVVGCIPVISVMELLRHGWPGIVGVIIVGGAGFISAAFIAIAIVAPRQRLIADGATRTVEIQRSISFRVFRPMVIRAEEITSVSVAVHESSDGPDTFKVAIARVGTKTISAGLFRAREEAEEVAQAIRQLLAP